jgi:hypothetical protein
MEWIVWRSKKSLHNKGNAILVRSIMKRDEWAAAKAQAKKSKGTTLAKRAVEKNLTQRNNVYI